MNKQAAMEREVELEHRALEGSTTLARIQRIADERTAKATDFEQKVALLEVECASLNQELQDMEARARRGQRKSPEEANQAIQAWQEEVERACQGQRDAESKLSSVEAEVQKTRVEIAAMKRDAEHYSRQVGAHLSKWITVKKTKPSVNYDAWILARCVMQVRRGADRAEIYSLAFSSNAQWLAVSSDKGTVHVFSLKVDSGSLGNNRSRSTSEPCLVFSTYSVISPFLEVQVGFLCMHFKWPPQSSSEDEHGHCTSFRLYLPKFMGMEML